MFTALLTTYVLCWLSSFVDAYYSQRAFAKGAVEGFNWIVALFGERPSLVQLQVFHLIASTPMAMAGVGSLITSDVDAQAALLGLSLSSLTVYTIKHVIGAVKGAKF